MGTAKVVSRGVTVDLEEGVEAEVASEVAVEVSEVIVRAALGVAEVASEDVEVEVAVTAAVVGEAGAAEEVVIGEVEADLGNPLVMNRVAVGVLIRETVLVATNLRKIRKSSLMIR